MKKYTIKLIAFTTAVLMMTASFASCTDKNTQQSSDTTTATSSEIKASENRVVVEGTKFMVNGKELWFNAVNTPWDKWNDFGGSFDETFWDTHFSELETAGVNATRIWINCDGMVGVKLKEDGSFDSVTEKHWQDLDKLFELAAKHKIYIMATLLSFDHFKDTNQYYDRWRAMIQSSSAIDSFVAGYVVPLVKRYNENEYFFSVDFMNEPDWVYENAECGKLSWDYLSNYFARAAAAVHENSNVLVTVGVAISKYNSNSYEGNKVSDEYLQKLSGNAKSYLDYYSTHYYFWQDQWFGFAFEETPTEFGLDGTKPCVIGECAAVDESGRTLTERYQSAYKNGWNGVFAWTSNGVDKCGGYEDVKPATTSILAVAEDKVYPNK